jgi:hypothetical protein
MPKHARWQWAALSAVLLAASCTNDYEQFDFGGRRDGSAGQAGSAGTAQGTGGQLGGPDGSSTGGAGGGDAQGGTGGGGSGGDAQGGTGDAQGGTSGGGTGGQAGFDGGGTSGAGGSCPGPSDLLCGGMCVDGSGRANCGACSNDCEQQGISTSSRFQCIDMRCGCTMSSQCGSMASGARCSLARCICNGNQCEAGERCSMSSGNCTCNGGPPCSQGQICCQDGGCRTSCG